MLGWFSALMPKEDQFFDLFERHAQIVVKGAEALQGLLKGGEDVERYSRQIMEREEEADEVTRQVLVAVRRSFITPFDRTDIQDLIGSMDDAIDQMKKTAKTILLFEVREFDPQMQQMSDRVLQASRLVLKAVPLLKSLGKNAVALNVLTEEIIRVEEQADHLHEQGRKAAFMASKNKDASGAMDFLIKTELYDHLETVVDRLEDVSNEINALVTDHI